MPCDGATAVIVSRRDATAGLPRHPLTVESAGPGMFERPTWEQRFDLTTMAAHDSAATLWDNTTLRPADVDMAQLYDGFSFLTVMWLEALGFCEHGRVGEFIEGGARIALDGELPLNTSGGQLSGGRLHGMGFLHEACVQLWGEGGERQAPRTPEVVAVGVGGGVLLLAVNCAVTIGISIAAWPTLRRTRASDAPPGLRRLPPVPVTEPGLATLRAKSLSLLSDGSLGVAWTAADGNDPAAPWRALGEWLGEAYQVADDIRDVAADPESLGKPVGQDATHGRPSSAAELGLSGAIQYFDQLIAYASASIPACRGSAQLRTLVRQESKRLVPVELTRRVAPSVTRVNA